MIFKSCKSKRQYDFFVSLLVLVSFTCFRSEIAFFQNECFCLCARLHFLLTTRWSSWSLTWMPHCFLTEVLASSLCSSFNQYSHCCQRDISDTWLRLCHPILLFTCMEIIYLLISLTRLWTLGRLVSLYISD